MRNDETRLLNSTEEADPSQDEEDAEEKSVAECTETNASAPEEAETIQKEAPVSRPWCQHCRRPSRICLCAALPSDGLLETRTRIMLLVHPKEVQRPLGTAPLLRLCLQHLVVSVGDRFPEPEDDPELHASLHEGGHRCMLVCPGNNAEEMRPPPVGEEAAAEEALFSRPPATLIFIDGRWPQAKSMVNRSTWLQQIPRVVLCPTSHSGYVFRKQPKEGCLSTLEAVAEALLALEGRRGPALKEALLAPFHEMVQLQCPFIPNMKDKNVRLEDHELGLRPFDVEEVLEELAQQQNPSLEVNCIVRWGDRTTVDGRREVIVMEVVKSTKVPGPHQAPTGCAEAKRRALELSVGRSRGRRCWVLPLGKVPPCSRMEIQDLSSGERSVQA